MKNILIWVSMRDLRRAALWAVLGLVGLVSVPALGWVQDPGPGVCVDPRGCDPSSDTPGGVPSGPSPEEVKQQQERARLKAKAWSSDEAMDYFDRKDWDNAIRSFEEALERDPDDPDLNNWLKRTQAEKAKAQMPVLALPAQEEFRQAQEKMAKIAAEQSAEERRAQQNSQIAAIVRGIKGIKVPPPISSEDAAIAFGQIAPGDHTSKNVIFGAEVGVAVADVFGKIGKSPLNRTKLIFAVGETFIAAVDGADVYIVRQNETYEKALRYLKDASTRQDFTAIVRAIKEHRPISENASIEMVRAAQAILNPKLGNSGMRIAWDAMLSPEARNAAMTRACIELGSEIIGKAVKKTVARLAATQLPAFTEATEYLTKARVALQKTEDPAARASLTLAIKQANDIIAKTYKTVRPGAVGMEHVTEIFSKDREVKVREKKQKE